MKRTIKKKFVIAETASKNKENALAVIFSVLLGYAIGGAKPRSKSK